MHIETSLYFLFSRNLLIWHDDRERAWDTWKQHTCTFKYVISFTLLFFYRNEIVKTANMFASIWLYILNDYLYHSTTMYKEGESEKNDDDNENINKLATYRALHVIYFTFYV